MTAPVSGRPLTGPASVRLLLLGGDDDADLGELRDRLAEQGVLSTAAGLAGGAHPAGGGAVADDVTGSVARLLDLDLGAMVLSGWRLHRELSDAVERTRLAPGSSERVVLAHHVLTASHAPRLELRVGGAPVGHLEFEVEVELDLLGVEAEVADGAVLALPCGDGEVSATLSTAGRPLLSSPRRRFSPGLVVRLRPGPLPRPRTR